VYRAHVLELGGTIIMEKCPYCLSETRPGDNFCLNCGNRLIPATPQPVSQTVSGGADATVAAPDNWAAGIPGIPGVPGTPAVSVSSPWSPEAATFMAGQSPISQEGPTIRADSSPMYAMQPEQIEQPGRLILRGERGEVLQEFVLDKPEMTIGRAPTSDILLAKDKLTSRRHATIHHDADGYTLRDENSANGTFVNGQQLETMAPYRLKDGDLIGIGEYELLYRASLTGGVDIEDMPTVNVPFDVVELTARTQNDEAATVATSDPYRTRTPEEDVLPIQHGNNGVSSLPGVPNTPGSPGIPAPTSYPAPTPSVAPTMVPDSAPVSAPSLSAPAPVPAPETKPVSSPSYSYSESKSAVSSVPASPAPRAERESGEGVTFGRLTSIGQPSLPDMSALVAALSALDGQVTSLQDQLNATQEALQRHEKELAQTTDQLRAAVRRVSDRMDSTIADVARSREALAWADLIQLMEDVMNNPRDIEYVGKLARKARELNKVFQIHQNVLNTMAECNSLLRSIIGD
jgi:pSer/pThr/pTyr-binding forkhead associated (FHA) protein